MLQGTYELNFQVACPLLTLCFLFPVDVVVVSSMVFHHHQSVLRDNNLSKPSTSSRCTNTAKNRKRTKQLNYFKQ